MKEEFESREETLEMIAKNQKRNNIVHNFGLFSFDKPYKIWYILIVCN